MTNTRITVDAVRSLTIAESLKMIEANAADYVSASRIYGQATVEASLTAHGATVSGALIDGRTPEAKRPALALTGQQYAEKYGVPGSQVTDWQMLGRALVVAKVQPDSPEWKALATNHASHKGAMRKVLKDEKVSLAKIRAALKEAGYNVKTGALVERTASKPGARNQGGTGSDETTTNENRQPGGNQPLTLANIFPESERILGEAVAQLAKASPTTRAKFRSMLAAQLSKVDGIIAADKGTPRSGVATTHQPIPTAPKVA